MDKVRIAIVGCGRISNMNAPGYLEHPQCEVYALCDPVEERAAAQARKWGIEPRFYTDYQQVLSDPNVDAVELLTPYPPARGAGRRRPGGGQACLQPEAHVQLGGRGRPDHRRCRQSKHLLPGHRELLLLPAHRQGQGAYRLGGHRRALISAHPHHPWWVGGQLQAALQPRLDGREHQRRDVRRWGPQVRHGHESWWETSRRSSALS